MLKKIPITLKRVLNKSWRTLYKHGKINGDLSLTGEGQDDFANYLLCQGNNAEGFATFVKASNAKDEDEEEEEDEA